MTTDPTATAEPSASPVRRCGRYVAEKNGYRLCGKPCEAGTDRCAEHTIRPPAEP